MTPQTVLPEDLKEGDEVTITLKGVVDCTDPAGIDIAFEGGDGATCLDRSELSHATITRSPRPLKVGDRVKNKQCKAFPPNYEGGEVLAIFGAHAWVIFPGVAAPGSVRLSDLEPLQ